MKKSFKVIIILCIVIIVSIVAAFAYIYAKTDLLKSEEDLFRKYMMQTLEQFQEIGDLQSVKEYQQSKNKYELETNVKIKLSDNSEETNPLNKLNAKINVQRDTEEQYFYGNAQILFENEKYLEAELIKKQDIYGIRFPFVTKQFVSVKNDESLKDVAQNLDIDEEVLQEFIRLAEGNNKIISSEKIESSKNKYLEILNKGIENGIFAKQKNVMITINDNTINANSYEVVISSEQVKSILIECLKNFKGELSLLEENSTEIEEYLDGIVTGIQNSQEISALKITVYEQKQKAVRAVIDTFGYKIVIDNANENETIKSSIKIINTEEGQSREIEIYLIKNTTENKEEFEIILNVIIDEEKLEFSLKSDFIKTREQNEHKIVISNKNERQTNSLEIENITKIGNDFEKIQVEDSKENIVLNDLSKEKQIYIMDYLMEQIPQKIDEKMEQLENEIEPEIDEIEREPEKTIIQLPNTMYNGLEITNIKLEYYEEKNETSVKLEMHNNTNTKVENEETKILLIGEDDSIIGQMMSYISSIEPGNKYFITCILKGDHRQAKEIRVMKKE